MSSDPPCDPCKIHRPSALLKGAHSVSLTEDGRDGVRVDKLGADLQGRAHLQDIVRPQILVDPARAPSVT